MRVASEVKLPYKDWPITAKKDWPIRNVDENCVRFWRKNGGERENEHGGWESDGKILYFKSKRRTETDFTVHIGQSRLCGGSTDRIWEIPALSDGYTCPERDGNVGRWQTFGVLSFNFPHAGPGCSFTENIKFDSCI